MNPLSILFFNHRVYFAVAVGLIGFADFGFAETASRIPEQSDRWSVNLGRSSVFQFSGDIKEILVADETVCVAQVFGNARNAVLVTGKMRGSTTVTVSRNDPSSVPQTFVVNVSTAPDAYVTLIDFIAQEFPESSISLIPLPSSKKVLVTGRVKSLQEWNQIKVFFAGSIATSDLIVKVTIPCPPCPCSPITCTTSAQSSCAFRN